MTSLSSPTMPGRARKPDSPSPEGMRVSRFGLVQWTAPLARLGALPKECAMGVPLPIVNCRVEQSVVDALDLLARQAGVLRGPYIRQVLIDHAAQASTSHCMKSFGLTEVLRRLSQPSLALSCAKSSAALGVAPVQQNENIGTQDESLVYAGAVSATSRDTRYTR